MPSAVSHPPINATLWVAMILLVLSCRPGSGADNGKDPYELLATVGLSADVKQGFALRADSWGGDLAVEGSKRIEQTLLRGNEYHFYAYTDTRGARISFHIQDKEGVPVEAASWQKEKDEYSFAGASIVPKSTGSYYLVVRIERSPTERTAWSLLYAYK